MAGEQRAHPPGPDNLLKARARDRLLRLADYLGATVWCEGHAWRILHYGVGDVVDDPPGHTSWNCLGRLVYVATAPAAWGGHGCTWAEVQDVIRCPYGATRIDGRTVMLLPDGLDATAAAMMARCCKAEFEEEHYD